MNAHGIRWVDSIRQMGSNVGKASSTFFLGDNAVAQHSFWSSDEELDTACKQNDAAGTWGVPENAMALDSPFGSGEIPKGMAYGRDYQMSEEHLQASLKECGLVGDINVYRKQLDKDQSKNKELDEFFHVRKNFPPYFTVTASIVNVLMVIFELVHGRGFESPKINPMLGPPTFIMLAMGGKWTTGIVKLSQWWRLFVAIYLHTGIIHLTLNLLTFCPISYSLERKYGFIRIFPIYIVSGVAGNIVSSIFLPRQITVGASGAIYGYFGILFVDLFKNWRKIDRPWQSFFYLFGTILISFLFGLIPGFDNFSHVSGFFAGILAGIVILPSLHIGKWSVKSRILQILVALPLLISFFAISLYMLYAEVKGISWCSWCRYISCIPIFESCNTKY